MDKTSCGSSGQMKLPAHGKAKMAMFERYFLTMQILRKKRKTITISGMKMKQ